LCRLAAKENPHFSRRRRARNGAPVVGKRQTKADESDNDGTFTLRHVLPGRYKVMAVEDGWDWEWGHPALLKKRLEHAQEIEVQPDRTDQRVVGVE